MRPQPDHRRMFATSILVATLIATSTALIGQSAPAAARLPTIVVLAPGGTIAGAAASDVQAGYPSGQVGVGQLLAAVPQPNKLAHLRGEQIANIGSPGMEGEGSVKLGRRGNTAARAP